MWGRLETGPHISMPVTACGLATGRRLPLDYRRSVPKTLLVDRRSLPDAFSPSAGLNRFQNLRIRLNFHRNSSRLSR